MEDKLIYLGQFNEKQPQEGDAYIREAEMFSVGTHRGVEYTEEDLTGLVENFSADDLVPVQLDHSESARDTVGFIREAYAEDGKLKGKLEILDEDIQRKIDKGLMGKLSIGFYLKHTEEGFKPHKLREVSLVAFPQVKGARLFSENGYVSDYEEEVKEMADNKTEQFSEEILSQAKEAVKGEMLEQFQQLQGQLDELQKVQRQFNENKVDQAVAKFSEDNKIVPAQADALKALLETFSEEQVEKFEAFMKEAKTADFSEQGEFEGNDPDNPEGGSDEEPTEFDKFYEDYEKRFGSTL